MGLSEQANTLVVDRDRNVLRTVGCVPNVTFLRSLNIPERTFIVSLLHPDSVGMLKSGIIFTIKC